MSDWKVFSQISPSTVTLKFCRNFGFGKTVQNSQIFDFDPIIDLKFPEIRFSAKNSIFWLISGTYKNGRIFPKPSSLWLVEKKIAKNWMNFPKNALNLYPENYKSKKNLTSLLELCNTGICPLGPSVEHWTESDLWYF